MQRDKITSGRHGWWNDIILILWTRAAPTYLYMSTSFETNHLTDFLKQNVRNENVLVLFEPLDSKEWNDESIIVSSSIRWKEEAFFLWGKRFI